MSEKITVYLAGGMSGDWQDRVMEQVPWYDYIDPRTHGLENEQEYTAWDLSGVKRSDIVFCYMEADNPSGYGLSLELGYAAALEKYIIFANEVPTSDFRYRYLGMARQAVNHHTQNFQQAVDHLHNITIHQLLNSKKGYQL